MPGVKISRREIKRDELATTIGGLTSAAERHARSIVIVAGALVALGLAVWGGVWFSRSRDIQAREKLAAVHRALTSPVAGSEAATARGAAYASDRQRSEDVVRLADIVLQDHPSSTAASWASYYKAVGQKDLGDYAGARATVEPLASSTTDEFLSAAARLLQAQIHEASGEIDQAIDAYAKLAASAPPRFPAELALMGQARLLEQSGRKEDAAAIYRRISEQYPDSPLGREAAGRLAPPRG